MPQELIKELFYSNGMDIFGPVSMQEFNKNKYYKSTLIWYEGLNGWVSIEDLKDLKHLIGTLSTPILNSGLPQALPNITPPLSKKVVDKTLSKRKNIAISLVFVTILSLITLYVNNKSGGQQAQNPIMNDTLVPDTLASKIANSARLDAEMKTYRMNWEKFIIAIPNDYRSKDIGGIEDLKTILKNNSPYNLDSVKVKVTYIKANGDTYQTEIMQFDNVLPNSNKELFAPSSNRGVKVDCSIIAVYSKAMNLCLNKTDKHFADKKGDDPFKCN